MTGTSRREWLSATAVCAFIVSGYLALASHAGAIGVSRGDDWGYFHVAFGLAADGVFALDGWVQTFFQAQALLAWPVIQVFGESFAALQISVAVLGGSGLLASYLLFRGYLPRWWAALPVACIALGPVFGTLSVSFVTDVPAFALQAWALLIAVRAMRGRAVSIPWLFLSLVVASAAFGIREYSLAAGLAIAVAALARSRGSARASVITVALLIGVWAGLLAWWYSWRWGLPNAVSARLELDFSHVWTSVGTLTLLALALALTIAPAVVALSPTRLLSACWRQSPYVTVGVLAVMAFLLLKTRSQLLGNFLQDSGSYTSTLAGSAPDVIPQSVSLALRALAVVSLVMIVLVVVRALTDRSTWSRARVAVLIDTAGSARGLCALCAAAFLAMLALAQLVTNVGAFDRYVYGIAAVVGALVIDAGLRRGLVTRLTTRVSIVVLAAWCVVGFYFVDNAATLDGAKWKLSEQVEARGAPADTVAGGFEWWGYHHEATMQNYYGPFTTTPWWLDIFPAGPVCVISQFDPGDTDELIGGKVVDSLVVHSLLGFEYRLVATGLPGCVPPSAA